MTPDEETMNETRGDTGGEMTRRERMMENV